MKKIIGFIIIFSMLLTITAAYAAEEILTFTIDDVQKQAVVNNKQAGLDDLDIKAKQSALDKANEDARMEGDAYGPGAALNNRIVKEVDTMEAVSNLETSKRTKSQNASLLNLNAYKEALNMIILDKQLDMENQKLSVLNEKLKIANAKLKSGNITENDLIDAEYNIENKQNDIANIEEQIKTVSLQVKNLLNLALDDKQVKIKDNITYQPMDAIDIAEFVTSGEKISVDIFQAQEKVKAEEKRMELTKVYYKAGESTFDSNELSLETAKMDLETLTTNLEVTIRNKYNDLLNQKDKVDIADKYLKLCDKKLANLQYKLKKGLISNEMVLSGKEEDIDAAYQKVLEMYNYSIQKAEFLNLSGK